jgi:hypothetical protein
MPGSNLCSFGAVESNEIIDNLESVDRIYDHKSNMNILIGIFCNAMPKCMLSSSNDYRIELLGEAIILSSKNKITIRHDRHFDHKAKYRSRFVQTIKCAV